MSATVEESDHELYVVLIREAEDLSFVSKVTVDCVSDLNDMPEELKQDGANLTGMNLSATLLGLCFFYQTYPPPPPPPPHPLVHQVPYFCLALNANTGVI